ncbi:MAG: serine/threonine protein kinase [Myxococcales bacterium]|nr:serine/threonine protein kinase [Myxococcales bacterium]
MSQLPPPSELPSHTPRLGHGRYVLMDRLGKGGMAGVFAAWDTQLDEWRAIKVLFPKHAGDRSLRSRFETEARTMRQLNHPNLVRVFDVGEAEHHPYMVMELVDAGSLHLWIKSYGPMPPRMAVEAVLQLCQALQTVHDADVVHRDVKPRNLLINWDGALKLTDFGIARVEPSEETSTGLALGTMGYMSPEQLHDAKTVDHRSDLYALGATLWAILTARKARDLFRLDDKPELMEGVPPALRPVLRHCLAYERQDRYQSAEDIRAVLEGVLPGLPPDPATTPPLPLPSGGVDLTGSADPAVFREILEGEDTSDADGLLDFGSSTSSAFRRDDAGRVPIQAPPPLEGDLKHRRAVSPTTPYASSDALPTYTAGVVQPQDQRRPETIGLKGPQAIGTPEPVPPPPQPTEPRSPRDGSAVRMASIAALGLLGLGVMAVLGMVGTLLVGTWQLSSAEARFDAACDDLSARVNDAAPIVRELEQLGASPDPLLASLEEWNLITDPRAKGHAAVAFVERVGSEARERVDPVGVSHEEQMVRQRMSRLTDGVTQYQDALTAWHRAAGGPFGRLSLRLGLADPLIRPTLSPPSAPLRQE